MTRAELAAWLTENRWRVLEDPDAAAEGLADLLGLDDDQA